jgi:predicted porin
LNLSFGNFAVGGVFEYFNDFASFDGSNGGLEQDGDFWVAGAGISYSFDPFMVGLQYSHQDRDVDVESLDDSELTLDRIVLTGNYTMGPGIALDGSLGYTWQDVSGPAFDDSNDNYDAFEIGLGTNFTF